MQPLCGHLEREKKQKITMQQRERFLYLFVWTAAS